ncbi:MAG TPA: cell envelope integrity protein CreD [Chitinophagaceae bacterium]|nr:cell envelope integrity protein CreD [Chitinophagaceae bacterium]
MNKDQNAFWQKNRLVIKAAFIGILTLLLLIPTAFIAMLINDRQSRHDKAIGEVSGKWAAPQTLSGPILVIPYKSWYRDDKGNRVAETKQAYFLPDSLRVNGVIQPEKRYRGIYEVMLYRSNLRVEGRFSALKPSMLKIPAGDWLGDQAYLMMGMDDMRGIENQVALTWNGSTRYFSPGLPENAVLTQGIYSPLPLDPSSLENGTFDFSIQLRLKGSGELEVVPLGKSTRVDLRSSWPTPSFTGSFLPDSRQVTAHGFRAEWTIFNLNRNLPQRWTDGHYDLKASRFGVSLMLPVDMYQKTMRCVKYAILIIALTFMVFFLVETSRNNPVHPFQYVLVGFALCIFYTLLLSLSEYLHFGWAYWIAAAATTGLVSLYSSWLFRRGKAPWLIGTALLVLYGFIFTLAQLQDFSLLIGSVGLFIALALVMYFSRRINWHDDPASLSGQA